MFDLIIIIVIIYSIYKKYNSTQKLTTILQAKGFSNIITVKQNNSSTWVTANFHGDNYLFEVVKNGSNVTNASINTLIDYAAKNHYHNIILVPGNSVISNTAKPAISNANIQIWDNAKLNSLSAKSRENVSSAIIQKMPLHDKCKIDTPQDPIQDGTKANSIFSNFFGNKIERL